MRSFYGWLVLSFVALLGAHGTGLDRSEQVWASSSRVVKLPDLEKLRLRKTVTADGREVTYHDLDSGASIRAFLDPLGALLRIEEYSPSGALLDRRTFERGRTGRFVHEELLPDGQRTVLESRSAGSFGEQSTSFHFLKGGKAVRTENTLPGIRGVQDSACPREVGEGEIDHLISQISSASLSLPSNSPGTFNLRIAGGSTSFAVSGCEGYSRRNGDYALADDFEGGLQAGVGCMAGTGPMGPLGPRVRMEAARLIAYLSSNQEGELECMEEVRPKKGCFQLPRMRERCLLGAQASEVSGANAIAITCPDDESPGMKINATTARERDPRERRETLFHEMLHWLGYKHYSGARGGVDLPYLLALCCMSADGRACDLLKATDPAACGLPRSESQMTRCPITAESLEYSRWFTRVMVDNGRPSIAYVSAVNSALREPEVTWSDGKPYPNLSSLMRSIQTPSGNSELARQSRVGRALLAYASAGNVVNPETGRFFDRAEVEGRLNSGYFAEAFDGSSGDRAILRFSESLGRMFSESLNRYGQSDRFHEMLGRYQAVRAEACGAMSARDRDSLESFQTAVLVHPVKLPSALRCIALAEGGPCSPAAGRCD
jgi:hypothetical protein